MGTNIVYCATSPSGRKYIGCTTRSLTARKSDHRAQAKKKPHYKLYKAFAKYGYENFTWEILAECKCAEDMYEMEKVLISEHDSVAKGYNITTGGEGNPGREITPEQRIRFSTSQRKRFLSESERDHSRKTMLAFIEANPEQHKLNAQRRAAALRKEENRKRASKNQLAFLANNPNASKRQSEKLSQLYAQDPARCDEISRQRGGRLFMVFKDCEFFGEFQNIQRFAKEQGINAGNISMCLKGQRNFCGGYQFIYSEKCEFVGPILSQATT
ncbi:hypothetical protein E3L83_05730 [Salmonella enterica]|nr:hypothetical protein [Salmonella enterica]